MPTIALTPHIVSGGSLLGRQAILSVKEDVAYHDNWEVLGDAASWPEPMRDQDLDNLG